MGLWPLSRPILSEPFYIQHAVKNTCVCTHTRTHTEALHSLLQSCLTLETGVVRCNFMNLFSCGSGVPCLQPPQGEGGPMLPLLALSGYQALAIKPYPQALLQGGPTSRQRRTRSICVSCHRRCSNTHSVFITHSDLY